MSEAPQVNAGFGVPGPLDADIQPKPRLTAEQAQALAVAYEAAARVVVPSAQEFTAGGESPEARMVRLRAAAQVEIDKESDQEIIARIVAEERAKRAEALLPKDTSGWPAEYSRITIFKGAQKFDKAYVELGLNGYTIKAPRGVPIVLPNVFITECLDHAIEDVTEQSQGGLICRPVHRFPYNNHGPVSADDYKAYQVQQKAQFDVDMRNAKPMSA